MKHFLMLAIFVSMSCSFNIANAKEASAKASAESRNSVNDVVQKIREDDEGLVVLFAKASGSYYLRRDVAQFDVYRKKLEVSKQSKKPVSVTAEPTQLNILEVK